MHFPTPLLTRSSLLSCFFILVAAPVLLADGTDTSDTETWSDRFQIHGHLSIAYADATSTGLDGRLVSDTILGLSEEGSVDYRNAALQLRYRIDDRHSAVLQLSHQRLADSPLSRATDDVEVDWLFWDWQVGPDTRLRLGRLPTPAGLFNELRDVGTVLPFFRPAFNFYREGSLFSESVDGVAISHLLFADSPWSLEANAYFGEFEVFEQGSGLDTEFFTVDASDVTGLQFWLDTPIDGVRLGVGALRWNVSEESQFNSMEVTWESWYTSIEADLDKWVARAEHRLFELPFEGSLGFSGDARVVASYVQLGWRATEKLSFFLQSEWTDIRQTSLIFLAGSTEFNERDDVGFAINYSFRPNLIFKVEYHEQDFEIPENSAVQTQDGLRLQTEISELSNEYLMIGLAYSF